MRKKKIIVLCLAVALSALSMVNGTLAYFTDTDSTVNVLTMGSVQIVQHEQQRKLASDGSLIELEPFENGKMLIPSMGPAKYLTYDKLDDSYKFLADGNKVSLPNAIDKIVTVENMGNVPAYVRTIFAFEAPAGFDRNAHVNNKPGWALLRNDIDGAANGTMSNTEWKWDFFVETARFNMDDGQSYVIAVATAQKPLEAGKETIPSLLQYYLNKFTDSEHVQAFGGSLEIYAFTQAVQADGFASADVAFKESFGEITYDSMTGKFSNLPWDEMKESWSTVADTSWYNDAASSFTLTTPQQLAGLSKLVNAQGKTFAGKTVLLGASMDMGAYAFTPIGQTGAKTFAGNFDGQGYTIRNLYIDSSKETGKHYSSGLFGWIENHGSTAYIQNVVVEGAKVTGHHNVGVIVGWANGVSISKCTVSKATISCTYANNDADGDKAGVIAGYLYNGTALTNCHVLNSTVSAGRDAGQMVGCLISGTTDGCTATNVTVVANGTSTGANIRNELIGRIS